jgi:hypothetical protein
MTYRERLPQLEGRRFLTDVISGCVGPHDDGYDPKQRLSAHEAAAYRSTQIVRLVLLRRTS